MINNRVILYLDIVVPKGLYKDTIVGIGCHGYFFTNTVTIPIDVGKKNKVLHTASGYGQLPQDNSIKELEVVELEYYINILKSLNNCDDLNIVISAIQILVDILNWDNVDTMVCFSNNSMLLNFINYKEDITGITPLFTALEIDMLRTKCRVKETPAINNQLGMSLALNNAHIASNKENVNIVNKSKELASLSTSNVKLHPFLNQPLIYFINSKNSDMYGIMSYKSDIEPGRKTPEAGFGLVILKKYPEIFLDAIKAYQTNMASLQLVSCINTKELCSSLSTSNYTTYGIDSYVFNSTTRTIRSGGSGNIIFSVQPPGLAKIALTKIYNLYNIIDSYYKKHTKETTGYKYYDITNQIYTNAGTNKCACNIGMSTKNIFTNITLNGIDITIPLEFGIDILDRNNIKKLEKSNPSIFLVVDVISSTYLEYYTVTECDDGVGIWCSFYSSKIFLK